MKSFTDHQLRLWAEVRHGDNPFNVLKVVFSPKAFDLIRKTVGSLPAETGGALYGKPAALHSRYPYIEDFVFDKGLNATRAQYTINHKFVNENNHRMWDEFRQIYVGHLHSHPSGFKHLSVLDIKYIQEMHTYMERPYLIFPVVFTQPDGGFKLFCYLIGPEMPVYEVEYCVMDEAEYEAAVAAPAEEETAQVASESESETAAEAPEVETPETNQAVPEEAAPATGPAQEKDTPVQTQEAGQREASAPKSISYVRIEDALDVKKLHEAKVAVVGCGGTYCFTEMGTRSGIRHWVLIDPDSVDDTNLCRQGYLPRQVVMKKVDAMAEHLRELDPDVIVEGYAKKVQELTFEEVESIFGDADLIIAATDSSMAQAFINKITMRYQVATIWAGFYKESQAMEIFFYIPGVTPGCYSCALWPRIQFQQEHMASNDGQEFRVSSACNTIFHSALLDAEMGMIAMAILHNNTEGKTFSGWFGDHFDRNFIQMKVNPAYESKLFDSVFAGAGDAAFLFESVWQHIEPDAPPGHDCCPDCHKKVAGRTPESTNEPDKKTLS